MPISSLQLQKKAVICREAEGLVRELWSPRFVTIQWLSLCCQLCCVTAANQRTIVEIELLATVSWRVAASLSAADVPKMWCTAERRHVPHVCLRNPFPLFLFGIPSIQPIRSLRFLRAAVRSAISALSGGIMPIPSLQPQKKIVLCREAEGLVTELWSKELLRYTDCALSCAMRLLQTSEQLSRSRF